MVKIILSKDIVHLGHAGDVKTVADGYARNSLLPRGFAVLYSEGALANIAIQQKAKEKVLETQAKEALALKAKFEKINLEFPVLVDEKGELYGSIGKSQILKALKDKEMILPKTATIVLQNPIKTLGESSVPVRLHPDVVAQLRVSLVKSAASR